MQTAVIAVSKIFILLFIALICVQPPPIKPACFVVLVVGIVVAALRVHELITHAKHGRSSRKHEQATEVLDLAFAKIEDGLRGVCVTLPATIVGILRGPILIVVAVGLVVPIAVRQKIVQRRAVMRRDVIDALEWME